MTRSNKTPATILSAALSLLGVSSASAAEAASQDVPSEIAIIRITNQIDRAVDDKDWPRARSYVADRVTVDFSSLSGQPAATIAADDLIGAWSGNLKGNKTSLHMRTNHDVAIEGERATVVSTGYAFNRMEGNGDPLWEVWGYRHSFTHQNDGWKVDGMSLSVAHERGNNWVKATPGN